LPTFSENAKGIDTMGFSRLTEKQLDALREISNVGMGHAATALSQLTGKTIHLVVPRVLITDTSNMREFLGDASRPVVGIHLRMLGNAQGNILMVFPRENAVRILEQLLPPQAGKDDSLSEMELSALTEVGNILASAYLNALGEMLKMTLIPSIPHLCIDTAGRLIDSAFADTGTGGVTLMLDTEFSSKDERVSGQFFLMPASPSLELILTALGIENIEAGSEL
jgi:chemotaxis protein CheC